jgi:hypothetical protein
MKMKKSIYRKPSVDAIPVENEGVMAASVDDFRGGRRYDIGHDLPRGALPAGGASPLLKLTRQLLPLLVLGLAVAACGGEETPGTKPAEKDGTFNLVVTATTESPTTRTTYGAETENGEDGEADILNVQWQTTDDTNKEYLYVIGNDGSTGATLYGNALRGTLIGSGAPTNGGKSLTFVADDLDAGAATDKFYNFLYYNEQTIGRAETNDLTFFQKLGRPIATFSYAGQVCDLSNPTGNLKKYDRMYTDQGVAPTTGDDATTVNVQLKHLSAVVYFHFTLPTEAPAINRITISASDAVFYNSVGIQYGTGASVALIGNSPTSTMTLKVENCPATGTEREIKAYMMVPAITNFEDILLKVSAYYDSDDNNETPETVNPVYSYLYSLYADDYNGDALEAGKCYTFGYGKTLAEDRWAGSNIYIGSAGKPTFNLPYDMSGVQYQGLFYTWGSLLGVSPTSPINNWTVYDTAGVTTSHSDWKEIDYDLNDGTVTHDICTAIDNTYRMPTPDDLGLRDAPETVAGYYTKPVAWTDESSAARADGTGIFHSGDIYKNITFFPASGLFDDHLGALGEQGTKLCYWTNFSSVSGTADVLQDYNQAAVNALKKASGLSIRCIKKAAGELSGE